MLAAGDNVVGVWADRAVRGFVVFSGAQSLTCMPIVMLRTILLRQDAGEFLGHPQEIYDLMMKETSKAQVGIPEIFWCQDEELLKKERMTRVTKNRCLSDCWATFGTDSEWCMYVCTQVPC